jgi:hypothetical protein
MNVGPVLDDSLTIHATVIRFGLYDTVRESPSISAGLGSGTGKFPAGHLLLVNWHDDLMNILHTMAYLVRQYQPNSSRTARKTQEI